MERDTHIEPRQTTPRHPEWAMISRPQTPMLKPWKRPDPIFGRYASKIILLAVQVRRNVVTEKGEEAGNGESLVTVANDCKVDGVAVEDK